MLKFMDLKSNEPKLPQNYFFKHLGFSDSTIKQYRDDINLDSPYNGKNYRKKNYKSNTSVTQS